LFSPSLDMVSKHNNSHISFAGLFQDSHEMKKPISSEEYATQSGHNLALESLGNTELYAEYRHVKSERVSGLVYSSQFRASQNIYR